MNRFLFIKITLEVALNLLLFDIIFLLILFYSYSTCYIFCSQFSSIHFPSIFVFFSPFPFLFFLFTCYIFFNKYSSIPFSSIFAFFSPFLFLLFFILFLSPDFQRYKLIFFPLSVFFLTTNFCAPPFFLLYF